MILSANTPHRILGPLEPTQAGDFWLCRRGWCCEIDPPLWIPMQDYNVGYIFGKDDPPVIRPL